MATLSAAEIKPGTTPILTVIVDDEAIQDATVYVTIDMKDRHVIKSTYQKNGDIILEPVYNEDEEQVGTLLTVQYSQTETLRLRPGYASVEVGWVLEDGTADKSDMARLRIPKTLYRGVMHYG